jgi:IS5 family transposase
VGEETCQERPEREGCRWTKKDGQSFYGYKNHIGVDKLHKIIRKWAATDASPHDSQRLEEILDASKYRQPVVGRQRLPFGRDRGQARSQGPEEPHPSARSAQSPAVAEAGAANTVRSKVRARVEHVFGHQESSMGRKIVRTIGMARARFKIGMMNLGYNMRRLVQLERMGGCARKTAPPQHAGHQKGPSWPSP